MSVFKAVTFLEELLFQLSCNVPFAALTFVSSFFGLHLHLVIYLFKLLIHSNFDFLSSDTFYVSIQLFFVLFFVLFSSFLLFGRKEFSDRVFETFFTYLFFFFAPWSALLVLCLIPVFSTSYAALWITVTYYITPIFPRRIFQTLCASLEFIVFSSLLHVTFINNNDTNDHNNIGIASIYSYLENYFDPQHFCYCSRKECFCFLFFSFLYRLTYFQDWETTGKFESKWFTKLMQKTCFAAMEKYFSLKIIVVENDVVDEEGEKNAAEKEERGGLFGVHPHGIMGTTAGWISRSSKWIELSSRSLLPPPHKVVVFAATAFIQTSIDREIILAVGAREVTKKAICNAVEKEKAFGLIVAGGSSQSIVSKPSSTRVVVKNHHLGFLKLSLQLKVPVAPVFVFGEHDILDNVHLPMIQKTTLKFLGFAFPVSCYGVWNWLAVPWKRRLTIVVGKSLLPGDFLLDEDKEIEKVLPRFADAYFAELKRIFYLKREEAGYPNLEAVFEGET